MKRNVQIFWSSLVIGHALLSNHGSTLPEPGVEAVDLGMLLLDLLDGAAAGVVRRLGMIGDADIAITTGEAASAIASSVSARRKQWYVRARRRAILGCQKRRDRAGIGSLDLVQALAQFRLYGLQAKRFIDLGLFLAATILRPRRSPSGVSPIPIAAARCSRASTCRLDPVARSRVIPKRRGSVDQVDWPALDLIRRPRSLAIMPCRARLYPSARRRRCRNKRPG
jgi:hypothetical protein